MYVYYKFVFRHIKYKYNNMKNNIVLENIRKVRILI